MYKLCLFIYSRNVPEKPIRHTILQKTNVILRKRIFMEQYLDAANVISRAVYAEFMLWGRIIRAARVER